MTIAACYLSAEGVVFGADSTSTMFVSGPDPNSSGSFHQFDYAQKIYEIGKDSTLGITMWGLGNLGDVSYRTMIAQFADLPTTHGAKSLVEVAQSWNVFFWNIYSTQFSEILKRLHQLDNQSNKTTEEENEIQNYVNYLSGGFCLGGYLKHDRKPGAYEIRFDPTLTSPGPVEELPVGNIRFWGCPNLMERLIIGLDFEVYKSILNSDKWNGSPEELLEAIRPNRLAHPQGLPIREAVDWVHASIYTTIKAMKFSHLDPVCGGPVEVAVITTDRLFRWVRHKRFDVAISQGGLFDA
jgi:hypothetical protein